MRNRVTAIIHRDEDMCVAICAKLGVISQGKIVELDRKAANALAPHMKRAVNMAKHVDKLIDAVFKE